MCEICTFGTTTYHLLDVSDASLFIIDSYRHQGVVVAEDLIIEENHVISQRIEEEI